MTDVDPRIANLDRSAALPRKNGELVFQAPWEGRAFGMAVVLGAVAGLLLGLPSRRLTGDYLAIVTLFFLQLFQTVMTNGDSVSGHNLTGGPNGILRVDLFD